MFKPNGGNNHEGVNPGNNQEGVNPNKEKVVITIKVSTQGITMKVSTLKEGDTLVFKPKGYEERRHRGQIQTLIVD